MPRVESVSLSEPEATWSQMLTRPSGLLGGQMMYVSPLERAPVTSAGSVGRRSAAGAATPAPTGGSNRAAVSNRMRNVRIAPPRATAIIRRLAHIGRGQCGRRSSVRSRDPSLRHATEDQGYGKKLLARQRRILLASSRGGGSWQVEEPPRSVPVHGSPR